MPFFGLLLALDMAGALFIVHAGIGVLVDNGGLELVLALGVAALPVAASGSGRLAPRTRSRGLWTSSAMGAEARQSWPHEPKEAP